LIQPYVQNSTRTTRPRSPASVSGALLIHGAPATSGGDAVFDEFGQARHPALL